jgi:hypothetical protein
MLSIDFLVDDTLEAVSYAIPVVIGVLTISPAWTLVTSFRRTKVTATDALYQDNDGTATENSMKAYSARRPFVFIFIGSALGLAASFGLAVFATVETVKQESFHLSSIWALNLAWVRLIFLKRKY